jgi:hypothetical protein
MSIVSDILPELTENFQKILVTTNAPESMRLRGIIFSARPCCAESEVNYLLGDEI